MAPKKKEQQKMSLGDFLADSFGGGSSWADEVEETSYVTGTQALPPSDRPRYNNNAASSWQDRGFSVREAAPQTLPDKPPYTAHLGNLSYDVTNDAVGEYLADCGVVNVRLIEDRELQRPKGFGYVEFETLDGLKKALTFDGENFNGRMIKIKVADPPRGGDPGRGDSIREMGNWDRKGPLPDAPSRGGARDFGDRERRPRDPAFESRPQLAQRMRPDAAKAASPDGSAPPSPALSNAAPAQGGRPRLNLQKRTVSEAPDASSASQGSDAKASPFGAARPIDTAAREKEIEVKRLQAIQEKKEADEKAKEERKLAKEAAAKQAAEAAEAKETPEASQETTEPKAEVVEGANGEQKLPIRNREPREGAPKSRATEASSWRSASNDQRGPRGGAGPRGGRGGRGGIREARAGPLRSNGSAAQQSASTDAEPATPTADDDGWTTVPNKKGRQGRAMAP
ncbi:hypothetical protein RAB80_003398 [Fusarium oxysporum f. sp. vasinfectum]|nr:hypothetical protein RAB80_003398 [Fusarium oxysporum f. sp. vasinfectum]